MKNKLLMTFVMTFLMALLLATVSVSAANWDNSLNYEKGSNGNPDLKVELKNWFGLFEWLGIDQTILTAELKSHKSVDEVKRFISGDQVVMYYDINSNYLLKNTLSEPEFWDLRTGKQIEKDYQFVYLSNQSHEISTYSEKLSENGSLVYVEDGTTIVWSEEWVPYNSKDLLKGKISIGLKVNVKWGDLIDGIWIIEGKKIDRHVAWGSIDIGSWDTFKVFNTTGWDTWTAPSNLSEVGGVEVLMVAGAGSGGGWAGNDGVGGGGAGGLINLKLTNITADAVYNYHVGFGAKGGFAATYYGGDGNDTYFEPLGNVTGGGGGGTIVGAVDGKDGGSGGGGYGDTTAGVGGNGVTGQGNHGGAGSTSPRTGGAGGGAGSVGGAGGATGGIGGSGLTVFGIEWACGGGGGDNVGATGGAGGCSSAGAGGGTANGGGDGEFGSGSGGGGGGHAGDLVGGDGGSGVIILAYNETTFALVITLYSPLNTSNFTESLVNFGINISEFVPASPVGVQAVMINVTDGSSQIFKDINFSDNYGFYNFSNTFVDGSYSWNATAVDDSDIHYPSAMWTFNIDAVPTILVSSPANISHRSNQIWFNATSNRTIDDWIVNYNGTNLTISDHGGLTLDKLLSVEEGNHHLILYGNNSLDGVFGVNTSRWFSVDTIPTISVSSPANSTYPTNQIWFNATGNFTIDDWIINYNGTNLTISDHSGVTLDKLLSVEDGNHNLILYGNNSQSGVFGVNTSRWFTVDATVPAINITTPLNKTYFINYSKSSTLTVDLKWLISDTHLDLCLFTNETGVNQTLDCGLNATLVLPFDQHTFLVCANDTFGNNACNSVTAIQDFRVLQDNIKYNPFTIEGSSEAFRLNFNTSSRNPLSVSHVRLNYNSTKYDSTIISVVATNISARSIITVPSVLVNENKTFFFEVELSNGIIYNSTLYNQTVRSISGDDCSTGTTQILNFTSLDEESQVNLTTLTNTTMEVSVKLFGALRDSAILNFSKSYINHNPAKVCLSTYLPVGVTIPMDVLVKYYGPGDSFGPSHATEYYNIFNYSLTNTTAFQNIKLYDLDSDDSTEFRITVTGDNFVPIEGALIFIERQYVAENATFKTVELPITDTNGQTLAHLVKNEVVYNLRAVKNGIVVAVLNNVNAFCEDLLLGDCEISMDTESGASPIYEYFNQGISFGAPTFNLTTNKVSFNYVSTDGLAHLVKLSVSKNDVFGNRSVCEDSLNSASGTLSCTVPGYFDLATLITNVTTDGQLTVIRAINVDDPGYGSVGYAMWFVLSLILIFVFGESKTGILVSLPISYIGAITMGLIRGDIIGLGSAGIWILVVSLVGIWKLNKGRPQ